MSGDAPATEPLCQLDDLPDPGARGFTVEIDGSPRQIIVVRVAEHVYGYLNWCPHRGTPLDWLKDQFLDREGQYVICATHGAYFQREDGLCVAGPCQGDRLRSFPVAVRDRGVFAESSLKS